MEKKTAISYKQIIKEEYKRCAKSIPHFLKKYSVIQHPTKGKIYFNLYDFQEKALNEFLEHRFNIVLKSRQLGLSTLVAGYVLWCLLFKRDYNVLIIATKQDVAKNLVTKIRVMHEGLPKWLQGETVEDNKLSLRFRNGSQVKAVASSEDAGRSEALSLLVLDEAAFIDKATAIWTSAQQTLAEGGSAIILSTPNGTGNLFHSLYKGAEDGENQFNYLRLPWQAHPHRDQTWRDDQTKLLGEQMSAQECVDGDTELTIRDPQNNIRVVKFKDLWKELNYTQSERTKISYKRIRQSLQNEESFYSYGDTRDMLLRDDFYLNFLGRGKNRTLVKAYPKLFKSIYRHTQNLENAFVEQGSYKSNYNLSHRIRFIVELNRDLEKLFCHCRRKLNWTKYCRKCPVNRTPYSRRNYTKDTRAKMRKNALARIEAQHGQIQPRYNVNSIPVLEEFAKINGITDLQHAENGGEYRVEGLGYFLDGYSLEKNIAIEFDEEHHFKDSGRLCDKDIRRQEEIMEKLGCEFVRVRKVVA